MRKNTCYPETFKCVLRRLTIIEPPTMPNSRKLDDAAEHGLNQPFIEEVTNHITSTEGSFIEELTVSKNNNFVAYPKSI